MYYKKLQLSHDKKFMSFILCFLILATAFINGCTSKNQGQGANTNGEVIKVGLVTDQGGAKDSSFNEAADIGIQRASKELGIERLNPIESKQQEQYQPNLITMAGVADLTIASGFTMESSMKTVADQLSNKKFVIVDAKVDSPNVASYLFKENEGAFLAGAMAGALTGTNKIGFIGGKESEVVGRFESGFIAGVASVNPEAAKGLMPSSAKTHGTFVKYINDFSDQSKAKEAANMLYNSGADIIFHAAGGAGEGLFKAAEEKKLFAIGVDSDQAATLPHYKNVILFSMIKKVDEAVLSAIRDYKEGNFKGGTTLNLGIKESA